MNGEYEEQALELDEDYEEEYIDSIAILEVLVGPGKSFGRCHFRFPRHLLIAAFRDSNLSWQGGSDWPRWEQVVSLLLNRGLQAPENKEQSVCSQG
jgi:hypothetical protein